MNDLTQAKKLIKECKETKSPYLDLGKCGITDLSELPELFECTHLETLILSNEWQDSENREWIYTPNKEKDNNISSIPNEIANLKLLTKLIINSNQITDISCLSNLTELQYLDLWSSEITDISYLSNLTGLKNLDLWSNKITDISCLSNLTGLQYLKLGSNQITDISCLSNLTGLQYLYLWNNQITDISCLSNLTELQYLNLGSNQITDISCLSNLTELQYLELSSNQITDISCLSNLTGLKSLDLRDNQIKTIDEDIFRLEIEINMKGYGEDGLCLYGNPIESPPMEIIEQGRQSILNWFAADREELNEIKIILIGEAETGKTSLLKRLKYGSFDEKEATTDGVNIEDIAFGKCDAFREQTSLHDITGHFWDFGGQDVMYATHQFFFTHRSIYILVLKARSDTDTSAHIINELKRINELGGNSPVIIVANRIDDNPSFAFTNMEELQDRFPQIKCFIKLSCKEDINIDILKNELADIIPKAILQNRGIDKPTNDISKLEKRKTGFDVRWIKVKNKLKTETETKDFLNKEQFIDICEKFELTDEQGQKYAIDFLNSLGVVSHFKNLEPSTYFVLNPYWVTYGVYQVLTSPTAAEAKGIIHKDQLNEIINEEKDRPNVHKTENAKKIKYNDAQQFFLMSILCDFKLCFYVQERKEYIIPALLAESVLPEITSPFKNEENNDRIQLVYEYGSLLKSILPNIMVTLHNLIKEKWRTGCILEKDGCEALISSFDKRITIIVIGKYKQKRELMAIIRQTIDSIKGNPKLIVPLPGIENGFVEYAKLIAREKKGKHEYIYDEYMPTEKTFQISDLLEGIPTEDEMRELRNEMKEFKKEMSAKLGDIKGDTEEIKNKLDSYFEYFKQNLNDDYDKLKNEIETTIKELNEKQTADITDKMMKDIYAAFEVFEGEMIDEREEICKELEKLKNTSNVETKLRLSIPLISLLGIDFGVEFDVKNWAKEMYKKYELQIFKFMGAV